ncbi:hypothetical protein CEUSTIGMA_g6556.t1 [Chlamydomonas eustigma]|uniref:VPS10 domain-containing protein n=1 Tax=Chlamydomonas eustigma TaxID=1157962 RepID=A0A250X7T6_9CHLO|nr:hypothetical protein CEUSTIGMA_g6556.t1 [Chlamydomonas eustigma]|eukprot:GAX79116.1 hypothetical protein CEUSTIGMA_g6556.t1 [Chlamydomonas eustigma]
MSPRSLWLSLHALLFLLYFPLYTLSSDRLQVAPQRRLSQSPSCGTDSAALTPLDGTVTTSPVVDLKWLDKNDQTVVAITKKIGKEEGGFWLSTDSAKTWVSKTQALTDAMKSDPEPVEVLGVLAQKSAPNNVVMFNAGTLIWSSTDYCKSVTAKKTPGLWRGSGIKSMKVHPWHDDWLLLLVKRPDCKTLDHAQTECPHDLWLTQDLFGAMTWTNLTENARGQIASFVDFDWGANLCPNKDCTSDLKVTDLSILTTMYQTAGAYDQTWDNDVHFVASSDAFKTFSIRGYCGNMFEVIGKSVYLAYANICPTDILGNRRSMDGSTFKGITLYTSQDGGNDFMQGCLPVAMKQEGYELLATQDGTGAIIIVDFLINNGMMDIPASSVYTAGPHHALFSLSLTDVYRANFGFSTDFARIEGLPGVYIANQMVARDELYQYYDIQDSNTMPLVETRITFNGGGKWQRIPAPSTYIHPKCNRCIDLTSPCYLHLRGMSSWDSVASSFPAVYSNPSAPGFIMATGVTASNGLGLEDDYDGTCTWLSTDGGVTWQDVAEGSYIYEFADWGSTIVMASHPGLMAVPADSVLVSVDYGNCWYTVPLNTAFFVDNIRIEPDGQRPVVVIHGLACDQAYNPKCSLKNGDRKAASPGIIYTVDVLELTRGKMGTCSDPDYEQFTVPTSPTDKTPACILGKVSHRKRRAADKMCFNGPDFVRGYPRNDTCNCTQNDVECDYGYIRSTGGKCVLIPSSSMPVCPEINSHLYSVSSTGLRMVHADVCMGIDAVIADTDGKGTKTGGGGGSSSSGGSRKGRSGHSGAFVFFMTLLSLAVLAGLFAGWWTFLAVEHQRQAVREVVEIVSDYCVNTFNQVRDRIRGRPVDLKEHDMGYFQPLGDMHEREAPVFTLK